MQLSLRFDWYKKTFTINLDPSVTFLEDYLAKAN